MKMNNIVNLFYLVLLMMMYSSSYGCWAFNITRLFERHPDYSTFNDLLTQTGVAVSINNRKTITVLAVSNSGMGFLSSRPQSVVRNVLATHVILDYWDVDKIRDNMDDNPSTLTTLYQTSGSAHRNNGFLLMTKTKHGVTFGSAAPNAPQNSQLIDIVASQPFNISVLHVSQIVVAPGMDPGGPPAPTTPPVPALPIGSPPPSPVPSPAPEPDAADGPDPASTKTPKTSPSPEPSDDVDDDDDDDEPDADEPPSSDEKANTAGNKAATVPLAVHVMAAAAALVINSL